MFYHDEKKLEDFLIKHNISPNQFDYLYRLYSKKSGLASVYRLFTNILKPNKTSGYLHLEEVENLLERKFIVKELNTNSKFPDLYKLSSNLFEEIFIKNGDAFEDIYAIYPKYIHVNGVQYNARNVDIDESKLLYNKKIANSINKHEIVLNELKNQIDKSLISVGLEKWLKSEMWREDTINNPLKVKTNGEDI